MEKFFTLLFFCCLFTNCSDDNSNEATLTTPSTTALASKPEANPTFDDSYMGIYKGIVIGNISGSLYIDLLNDNRIWAKLQTDNHETYILENIPLSGSGKSSVPLFRKFRFANENISFEIKLDEYGDNISVSNLDYFSNDAIKINLVKEKSTSLIKCYTGSFTSQDEFGSVNFTTDGELKVKGLTRNLNSTNITSVSGEIDVTLPDEGVLSSDNEVDPDIKYRLNANLHFGQISGYLKKYTFEGNWMLDNNEIGNWNATRIL